MRITKKKKKKKKKTRHKTTPFWKREFIDYKTSMSTYSDPFCFFGGD